MTRNLRDDRLEQLRGDLAALRARSAAEFGVSPRSVADDPPSGIRRDPERVRAVPASGPVVRSVEPIPAYVESGHDDSPPRGQASTGPVARSRPAGRSRRPRPPRRRLFRQRVARPPARLAIKKPIVVRRRPAYLAGPRWPVWKWYSGAIAILILFPAFLQLAYRLVQAVEDTTVLFGADPTRSDYLRAAAGVAGGGLTLALAVAAMAVVKLRWGYLAAAIGTVGFFGVLPYFTYTATAGIVSAPLPALEEMIRPAAWGYSGALAILFWVCLITVVAAVLDLLIRSGIAVAKAARR